MFVFSAQPGGDKATVYSRMFAPELGVAEDPATGGASGPLGCYLVRHKVVTPEKARAMLSLQGVKMGRPSHVHISIGVEKGEIASVRVGGEAVLAGEGTLTYFRRSHDCSIDDDDWRGGCRARGDGRERRARRNRGLQQGEAAEARPAHRESAGHLQGERSTRARARS